MDIDKDGWYVIEDKWIKGGYPVNKEIIVNHSKNIIDLIEVGDYVNGMLVVSVTEVTLDDKCIKEKVIFVNRDEHCTLKPLQICNGDIKSIVIKEQYKSVEYKLKED